MDRRSLISLIFALIVLISSCINEPKKHKKSMVSSSPIVGTWELLTRTIIENGDTTITDYTKNARFIKIINDTHFTFLNHDLNKGADSTATFVAGGGKYALDENKYKEKLEYCNYREWEGNDFEFEVKSHSDTLIQKGVERIEDLGVDRLNIEVYVRTEK